MRRKRWMVMMLRVVLAFFCNRYIVLKSLGRSVKFIKRKEIYLQNYEQFAVALPALMRNRKPEVDNLQLKDRMRCAKSSVHVVVGGDGVGALKMFFFQPFISILTIINTRRLVPNGYLGSL